MFGEMTPAVTRALHLAQMLATELQSIEIEPLHLLHALLQEEEGRPFLLLVEAGLDREQIRRFARVIPEPPAADEPGILVSLPTKRILREARGLAREIAFDPTISSEHLLLAILQEDVPAREALEPIGLELARLETLLLDTLAGAPLPMEEPLELTDRSEDMEAARILDANANRAREALRVLEDYCRFVLDDAFLSRQLKTLRHQLAAACGEIPARLLLAARDTMQDVGTGISTASEQSRASLAAVVRANLKRLQEALRSLEEYGKLFGPELGQTFEQMRYQSYTLERMLVMGQDSRQRLAEVRLYVLLTGSQCWAGWEKTLREVIEGGAGMVQLREKEMNDRDLLERRRQVRRVTRETGTLFIMNDRPDIARLVEADGVHIGQEELHVKDARRILGADALIGVSTHDLEQVHNALRDGADYIGVGPTFPSKTKTFAAFPGLEFVRQVSEETSLPAFVIGGVNLANLPEVIAAGGRRIAVSQSLCGSETPQALAETAMRGLLDGAG